MFHHLSTKSTKVCRNFGLQRENGLKILDAHPYPRLYRSAPPPPRFLGIFQELVFEMKLVFQHKLTKQTWRQVKPSKINAQHIPRPLFS